MFLDSVFFPRENRISLRENFRCLPVNIWNVREKILKSTREIQKVTVKVFSKSHAWKNCWCTRKFLLIYPVKTITKPNFYVRENKNHTRKKITKSVREKPKLCVKKCAWKKKNSVSEKNSKRAKNGFHGHFWFSRGSKKTLFLDARFSAVDETPFEQAFPLQQNFLLLILNKIFLWGEVLTEFHEMCWLREAVTEYFLERWNIQLWLPLRQNIL